MTAKQRIREIVLHAYQWGQQDALEGHADHADAHVDQALDSIEEVVKDTNALAETYARIIARVYNGEKIEVADKEEMAKLNINRGRWESK